MNFQDLFARYREMGAMAPQSLDEQLFMRSSWTFSDDLPDPPMDLPSPENTGGTKKERFMFKLPPPNTFRPFHVTMDEEHQVRLSGDEEVEDLLQSSPPQGWNLGLLKNNSLCKDYYKLTSNVLRALVMGIKEFADGEISPAWQVAQERANQKQSNFSNIFLQDAGKIADVHSSICCHYSQGKDGGTSKEINPSVKLDPKGTPTVAERSKDIVSISELRKWLWGQLVPNTSNLDPRQDFKDGEKDMKVVQESRMKIINSAGFAVSADNYNSAFPETCHVSFKLPPQLAGDIKPSDDDKNADEMAMACVKLSSPRIVECIEAELVEEDGVDQETNSKHTSSQEEAQHVESKNNGSFMKTEVEEGPLLQEVGEVEETQPLRRNRHNSRDTRFERPQSFESNGPAVKETRFSFENKLYSPNGEFEIVRAEIESRPRSPEGGRRRLPILKRGLEEGSVKDSIQRDAKQVARNYGMKQQNVSNYKETSLPTRPVPRSWCVVGGFTTRSRVLPRKQSSTQTNRVSLK